LGRIRDNDRNALAPPISRTTGDKGSGAVACICRQGRGCDDIGSGRSYCRRTDVREARYTVRWPRICSYRCKTKHPRLGIVAGHMNGSARHIVFIVTLESQSLANWLVQGMCIGYRSLPIVRRFHGRFACNSDAATAKEAAGSSLSLRPKRSIMFIEREEQVRCTAAGNE
jgi:hypothetical protein